MQLYGSQGCGYAYSVKKGAPLAPGPCYKTMMRSQRGNLAVGIVLAGIHVLALAALWPALFNWPAIAVMALLGYLTGGIGIALGFHRTLTHRSVRLWKPVEYVAAICGCLALQGSPIEWVATHRAHHAHTDRDGDPHNAHAGLRWTHFLWMVRPNPNLLTEAMKRRYAADLYAEPFYRFLDRYASALTLVLAAALYGVGGLSFVVWGIFVRLVLVSQFTWLVNSAAHATGYRSFETDDRSTNCWWVALLGWGEGWHNNHHAFPFSARHGLRWFELDVTWVTIKALQIMRVATDVRLPTPQMLGRLRAVSG
jgi:sn-1 stearoyl-lipid 9-desaturase